MAETVLKQEETQAEVPRLKMVDRKTKTREPAEPAVPLSSRDINNLRIAAIEELTEDTEPNTVVLYDNILNAVAETGHPIEDRECSAWAGCTSRWRKREFEERNRVFRAVPGVGYLLLNSDGRVAYSAQITKLAKRRLQFALAVITSSDNTTLSDAARRQMRETLGSLSSGV